jgi:hypothetical protein
MEKVRGGFFNCYTSANATILKHYNINPYMIFANGWSFTYEDKIICGHNIIGCKVGTYIDKMNMQLEKDIKLSIKNIKKIYKENALPHVKEALSKGIMVGYWGYSFWCPWSQFYKNSKDDVHYFLITGIDKDTGAFLCMDTSYNTDNELLDIEHFLNGFIEVNIYEKLEENSKIYADQLLQNAVVRLFSERNNAFDQMRMFSYDVRNKFDFNREIGSYSNSIASPLLLNLKEVSTGRKGLACLLDSTDGFLYEIPDLDKEQISKELKGFALSWEKVRLGLIKCRFDQEKKKYINKVADDIDEIILEEYNTALKLKDIFELNENRSYDEKVC